MAQDTSPTENPSVMLDNETTQASQPFVGQWNQLVSTTNWDKGAIICEWRKKLEEQGVPSGQYSDEAWSQMVGGVTPQHVGRLRRTYDRFGHVYSEYDSVFWSHFYAALEWDDAEMWLEGAVQNAWSVSAMRKQRWETLGKVGEAPTSRVEMTEVEEETQSLALSDRARNNDRDYVEGPVHEGPDWGDDSSSQAPKEPGSAASKEDVPFDEPAEPHQIRPFESFTNLPDDVMEAVSAFKVAIIRLKSAEWEDMPLEDMLGLLDALKQLAKISAK